MSSSFFLVSRCSGNGLAANLGTRIEFCRKSVSHVPKYWLYVRPDLASDVSQRRNISFSMLAKTRGDILIPSKTAKRTDIKSLLVKSEGTFERLKLFRKCATSGWGTMSIEKDHHLSHFLVSPSRAKWRRRLVQRLMVHFSWRPRDLNGISPSIGVNLYELPH